MSSRFPLGPRLIDCILCKVKFEDYKALANHVKRSHGKQAKEAYKKGSWKNEMNDNLFSNTPAVTTPPITEKSEPETIAETIAEKVVKQAETAAESVKQQVIIEAIKSLEVSGPSYIEPKADMIYGATGSGKTENISEISDYVLAKYGKLTRMVTADGGGVGPAKGKADSGQIECWTLGAWKNPIASMWKAVRGYWPLRLDDPESPLVPPDAGTWEVYGFGAFEGLTSWGDKILENLKATKASLSQDPSYTFNQDGVEFSGGNMSYFGFMQDQLQSFVGISHLLGYEKVLWTAQESKGDDQSGVKVYGPMIGGKKATGKAGGWFLNVFHMDIIAKGAQVKDDKTGQMIQPVEHVLFLKTHIDPITFVPFPCKLRAPKAYTQEVPTYLTSGSVAEAYRLLDGMYERQAKESTNKMSEITGLRERLLEKAAKAKLAEKEAMERRAKAAGMLKPMVSVPASIPAGGAVAKPQPIQQPVAQVAQVAKVSVPAGVPTIQQVRKK